MLDVKKIKTVYQQLNKDNLHLLDEIYDEKIVFSDPLHQVHGMVELKRYFQDMYDNVSHVQFDFTDQVVQGDTIFLVWSMQVRHSRLKKGKTITVEGVSHLLLEGKIVKHRDYFDAGQLLYENVPFLGRMIKCVKERVQ